MATLLELRTKLNYELGVTDDAGDTVYPKAFRSQAIGDAYAELWRVGIQKPAKQDVTTVADQWAYPLTSIRRLHRIDLLDSSSRVIDQPKGVVESDGSGGYQLRLTSPLAAGYTMRVYGWAPYASTFASDSASDDVPAEWNRVPLTKARAVLLRGQAAKFARYGTRQQIPPEMNASLDGLLALAASAEREYVEAVKAVRSDMPRIGAALSVTL